MKFKIVTGLFFVLLGADGGLAGSSKPRFADAASDACASNCSIQAASCKRICPATFSTPCLSACDSQAQTCTRNCQTK
jgi:hypothetical protein